MKHGAHHVVVSPVDLGIVTVRVNAPELPGWVVPDEPLVSLDVGCVICYLQKVGIFQDLSVEMRAGIDQGLDLTHKESRRSQRPQLIVETPAVCQSSLV